jgi:hypothetical protein
MKQMQDEMLRQCKFDGSFPKPVIMGMGIMALARNQKEYDELTKHSHFAHIFMGVCLVILGLVVVVAGFMMIFKIGH